MVVLYGTDIMLNFETEDIMFGSNSDFKTISEEENLKQAIKNLILTKIGTLFSHDWFGSKIHSIIGEDMTDETKNQAGGYVYEALEQEYRIDTINSVNIDYKIIDGERTMLIFLSVTPVNSDNELIMVIDYSI